MRDREIEKLGTHKEHSLRENERKTITDNKEGRLAAHRKETRRNRTFRDQMDALTDRLKNGTHV